MHRELVVWSSFIWVSYEKPSSSILCDVIFLVRLQGKFDIDHIWEWKGLWFPHKCLLFDLHVSRAILTLVPEKVKLICVYCRNLRSDCDNEHLIQQQARLKVPDVANRIHCGRDRCFFSDCGRAICYVPTAAGIVGWTYSFIYSLIYQINLIFNTHVIFNYLYLFGIHYSELI